jgi:RNase P/RNase MRP subunit p29
MNENNELSNSEESEGLNFSVQSISELMGSKKAFVTDKGHVDVGIVQEVVVSKDAILKVKIKGERTASVPMKQVYWDAKGAYEAAIKFKREQKTAIDNDISALKGRIQNIETTKPDSDF